MTRRQISQYLLGVGALLGLVGVHLPWHETDFTRPQPHHRLFTGAEFEDATWLLTVLVATLGIAVFGSLGRVPRWLAAAGIALGLAAAGAWFWVNVGLAAMLKGPHEHDQDGCGGTICLVGILMVIGSSITATIWPNSQAQSKR